MTTLAPCPTVPRDLVGKEFTDVEDELSRDTNPLVQYTIAGGCGFSFVARKRGSVLDHTWAGQPIDTALIL